MRQRKTNKMEAVSLEERILLSSVPPALLDINMISGKTDIQYKEEGKEIIGDFRREVDTLKQMSQDYVGFATQTEENFIRFFSHLRECWDTYLDLAAMMNSFSENLTFLYPEKAGLFHDLADKTFRINTYLYFITDIEKEIYERNLEKLPEDRMIGLIGSVRSFPVYIAKIAGGTDVQQTGNPYHMREILKTDPWLRKLFHLAGSSLRVLGNLSRNTKGINRPVQQDEFKPKDAFEESLQGILAYDHFLELFLRKSGILMNDLKFYVDLSERISCRKSVPSLLRKLSEIEGSLSRSFQPMIPQYMQTQLSCGATCLANVVGTYFPHINVDRSLEDGIHRLVTVPGFFNNLPSSLAYVSKDRFGIPSHFYADMKTFAPLFLRTKAQDQPVRKFQEDYEHVKDDSLDYGGITADGIKGKLRKGHMISYVTGSSPMLHYRMIIGYNLRDERPYFHVFDPAHGMVRVDEENLLSEMRNDKSLWGVEYAPPESVIFAPARQSIEKAEELLRWKL